MQPSNAFNVNLLTDCSIQALLSAPNPDDPLSENIAKHWKANEAEAVETGKCSGNFSFVKMKMFIEEFPQLF